MELNFSTINLSYLLRVREVARAHPTVAPAVLGLPPELAEIFAALDAEQLAGIGLVKPPLLVARGDPWWWARLLEALKDGRSEEIDAVLEHAHLAFVR